MNELQAFQALCRNTEQSYWTTRILTEIEYISRLYQTRETPLPSQVAEAVAGLQTAFDCQGTLTRGDVLRAEEILMPLSETAREIQMLCVAHAHVDMNWEWGTPETVGVIIDTFQTMLDIMEEYSDFTFSQSQASTYEVIERYCPSMLPDIRRRVHEGRWEVTASTWVEPDKNMAGSEAMARHVLYTKRYLADLLDMAMDSMEVDFEPDTFGHSANIPEILRQGGVRYYYHCRGREGKSLAYRWQAPSGAEVLAYMEPYWYSSEVNYNVVLPLPQYCHDSHTNICLNVYGVGDHGGGPTRRDIERLLDMASWPLMPTIRFSTLHEFFHLLEKDRDKFPVVRDELNCLFTGCYTSQAQLKLANRIGEERLYDAEMLSTWSGSLGDPLTHYAGYADAWKKVLFNQFHDILPGSCVPDSRTQALGSFQEALACCVANANRSMKWLSGLIATDAFGSADNAGLLADGAGVGYNLMKSRGYGINAGSTDYGFAATSHGDGRLRVFTLFNTTQYDREDSVELTLWDWQYPLRMTQIFALDGEKLPFDVREEGTHYWGHHFARLATVARVPALGYTCVAVRFEPEMEPLAVFRPQYGQDEHAPVEQHSSFARPPINTPRITRIIDQPIVLENEIIRAEFAPETMKLVSLTDRRTGHALILPDRPSAFFRLVSESDYFKRSAWTIGPYGQVRDLNQEGFIRVGERLLTGIHPYVQYELPFENSKLRVTVSLPHGSATLRFSIQILWREFGEENGATPLLQFYVPFGFSADTYRYDIPCGSIERSAVGHDVPAIRYAAPVPTGRKDTLSLTTDCKYGYRGLDNSLIVNLLHAPYFPDPCPDIGEHSVEIGLTAITDMETMEIVESAMRFAHPIMAYSSPIHPGRLAPEASFFKLEGPAQLVSLKRAEDSSGQVVLRLCQEGKGTEVSVISKKDIHGAWLIDLTEAKRTPIDFETHCVRLVLPPNGVRTLCLALEEME